MDIFSTEIGLALELDAGDELARFRDEFVIAEPDVIYLDGNSLGRLPRRTLPFLQEVIERQWGQRLVRAWNDGWWDEPHALGARLARLIGAGPDEVLVAESTSTNLFNLSLAALGARLERRQIVSDTLNFPSDLYILQGVIELLGRGHELILVPSADGITVDPEAVEAAIGGDTGLVCLTHVAFKSAFMYDMARITRAAHAAGALILWDLSHSVGAVPLDLDACEVDLAVGCSYKYLNGGPGAPAFLYVRRDLQEQLSPPVRGWFASASPFDFALDFHPAPGMTHFRVGSPPILSLKAIEPAVDLLLEAGIERLRRKSVRQTEYLIYLAEEWLFPLGFSLGSPRSSDQRGSHVSLRHPEGYRINRAMIESPSPAVKVIPDFRAPDNIRLGVAPLYTSFVEVHRAIERMRVIVADRLYERYSPDWTAVT
jgi:kynureninase